MIDKIYAHIEGGKWSADNLAFGMGGALLQKLDRDTQKFAFKCSYVHGAYGDRDVWKQPVGDASKASKRGKLALVSGEKRGDFHTFPQDKAYGLNQDKLREVYRDGEMLIEDSFDQIRQRADVSL
jgi:nicotinamide phosphoribosyltransferase